VAGLVLLGSCGSPTEKISNLANEIRDNAVAIGENARLTLDALPPSPEGDNLARLQTDTIQRASAIENSASSVQVHLTGTQDKESTWFRSLRLVTIISVSVALLVALWVFRRPLSAAGAVASAFLDPLAKARVRMDVEALEATPDNQALRESIAASRGADPKYNAMFKLEKNKLRKEQAKMIDHDKIDTAVAPLLEKTGFNQAGTVKRRWMAAGAGFIVGVIVGFAFAYLIL